MKVLPLLVFAGAIGAGCVTHTHQMATFPRAGSLPDFRMPRVLPILPPIPDVDPSIRHKVEVEVPTRLTVERESSTLSIAVDRIWLEPTNIMVGLRMVPGVQWQTYIYPADETRPSQTDRGGLYGGLDFNLGTSYLHTKPDGIPAAGKNYVVEMDLSIFETDVPGQHMWSPYSKNFRVLWKRTLRHLVE